MVNKMNSNGSYAVIETGGKQYKVSQGDRIWVETQVAEVGQAIKLDKVLALSQDGQLKIGQPLVSGSEVSAKVIAFKKQAKTVKFQHRKRKNHRKKTGHRQTLMQVEIEKISA